MAESPSTSARLQGRAPESHDARRPGRPGSGGGGGHARRRLLFAVLAVLVLGGAVVLRAWQSRDAAPSAADTRSAATALDRVSGQGAELAPPWAAPADAMTRVQAAGLQLGGMGKAEHYHVHLDVIVDGAAMPVPADIGVDGSTGAMSYLHTHTPDGVVHIEAGRAGQAFTLGQLFTEWDVRLTANQLGGLTATQGNALRAFVNGKRVPGDPARVRLAPHQQIALVYGPADAQVDVPSTYAFAAGD